MAYLMRVIIVGDNNSGKEMFLEKYLGKKRQEIDRRTIGAEFGLIEININEQIVKLQFWELTDEYQSPMDHNTLYYGALGGIIVFDVTKRETFDNLENQTKEIWEKNGKGVIPLVIFGKNTENRERFSNSVTKEEGKKMASRISKKAMKKGYEIPYFEISIKTGENIVTGFKFLAKTYISYVDSIKP